jgi:hypothetical protein
LVERILVHRRAFRLSQKQRKRETTMISNLVLYHPYAVLGILGLISMVLCACAIQLGEFLYGRFQRNQIKHELGKIKWHKLVAAILVSFTLLTSQMAFGQTAAPKSSTAAYQKLFTLTGGLAASAKKVCKTEACAKAADELAATIANGQEKYSKGLLVGETRTQFHADLQTNLIALRAALLATLSEKERKDVVSRCPTCNAGKLKPVQGTSEECQYCFDVLEVTAEICALYLGTCNTCALICLSTAILAYGRCIREYCPPDYGPNTN